MKSERIINTKRNAIWAAISKIVSIIFPFLSRTVLIHILGIEYIGLNGLFSSILQVLSLAELGFSSAIIYSMYKPLGEEEDETVCALLQFYKKIYSIIGLFVLGVGGVLIPFLPKLINGDYPSQVNLYVIYLIYLSNTVISYFLFAYKKSLLTALQRNDLISKVTLANKVILCLFQIIVLTLFKNFYIYLIIIPITTITDNLMSNWLATKYYGKYIPSGKLDSSTKHDIIEKTKGLLLHKICGVTRNACDNIVISIFLGITPVGIYSNYYYIMTSIRGMLDVISVSMSASIGNSVAFESVEKNYENLNVFTFMYEWICGWCTICLLCLYQPFMKIWTGEKGLFSFDIVIALCIYFYVWTMGDMKSQYSDANGLWYKDRFRTMCEAIGNVVLNVILVQRMGVFGVVIATVISYLIIGFPWSTKILFDNYFCKMGFRKYMLSHVKYAAVTLVAGSVTYYVTSKMPFEGIINLMLIGICCVVLPNIIYVCAYRKSVYLEPTFDYVKKVLGK